MERLTSVMMDWAPGWAPKWAGWVVVTSTTGLAPAKKRKSRPDNPAVWAPAVAGASDAPASAAARIARWTRILPPPLETPECQVLLEAAGTRVAWIGRNVKVLTPSDGGG